MARPTIYRFLLGNLWHLLLITLVNYVNILYKSIAENVYHSIKTQFDSAEIYQKMMLNYFLVANGVVNRQLFATFANSDVLWKVPSMLAVQYSQVVTDADRATFEAAASLELGFNYEVGGFGRSVWRLPQKDVYVPILYSEPYNTSRSIFGLDILAQSTTLINTINSTGVPLLSDRLKLAQTGNYGNIKYYPMYRSDSTSPLQLEVTNNLIGFIAASYDIQRAITASLKSIPLDEIDVFYYNHNNKLMAIHAGNHNEGAYNITQYESYSPLNITNMYPLSTTYTLQNTPSQAASIIVCGRPEFLAHHLTWVPYIAVSLGLVVSMLDTGYMFYRFVFYDRHVQKLIKLSRDRPSFVDGSFVIEDSQKRKAGDVAPREVIKSVAPDTKQ
ncbi:hypothetical protein HDV02_003040 [Globomyces sp. JEL0801]|nr:hypothetical protein HDV02_003040 [Globomyces sp. JEL0801]